jgi:hypothetical protein
MIGSGWRRKSRGCWRESSRGEGKARKRLVWRCGSWLRMMVTLEAVVIGIRQGGEVAKIAKENSGKSVGESKKAFGEARVVASGGCRVGGGSDRCSPKRGGREDRQGKQRER